MPKFSILIPCYNCAMTLPDTLASCLRQEFDDFEVVLVDDCSKENIVDIYNDFLPLFTERRIRLTYHRNEVNSGVSFSRNLAWDQATGEYICFLDSDDVWHASKLQIINHILSGATFDCMCHLYTDKKEQFSGARRLSDYLPQQLSQLALLLKNPSQTSCFVLRRSIAERFDTAMSFCEDYDLWLRISNAHRIFLLSGMPLTLLSRPQHTPGGLSASRVKMRLGEMASYLNLAKRNSKFKVLFPLLVFYSALKHVRSELRFLKNHSK